jgi:bifunctional non-homologous end joining protein LigD
LPLSVRKLRLRSLIRESDQVKLVDRFRNGQALWNAVVERGLEGIVAKRLDSAYTPGVRTANWLKLKCKQQAEFAVVGYYCNSTRSLRGLLLATRLADGALAWAGRCSSGLTDREAARLLALLMPLRQDGPEAGLKVPAGLSSRCVWVEPEVVCRVEFTQLTAGGLLRHPVYKSLVQ